MAKVQIDYHAIHLHHRFHLFLQSVSTSCVFSFEVIFFELFFATSLFGNNIRVELSPRIQPSFVKISGILTNFHEWTTTYFRGVNSWTFYLPNSDSIWIILSSWDSWNSLWGRFFVMSAQRDLNRHLRFRIGTCRNIPNCRLINEILQTPQVPHWNLSELPLCSLSPALVVESKGWLYDVAGAICVVESKGWKWDVTGACALFSDWHNS